MKTNHVLENPATGIEDIFDKDGLVVGKTFIAVDLAGDGETFRIPMSSELARRHGQALMGIGKVDVVDSLGLKREIRKQGKG